MDDLICCSVSALVANVGFGSFETENEARIGFGRSISDFGTI